MDDIFEYDENGAKTESSTGNIKISNEVIAAISSVSAEEIKGVACMYTSFPETIAEKLGSKKSQSKGVRVVIGDNGIQIDLYIVIEYGVRIRDIAFSVQESVKNNVETMTGMNVSGVNVHVEGVSIKESEDNTVRVIDETE